MRLLKLIRTLKIKVDWNSRRQDFSLSDQAADKIKNASEWVKEVIAFLKSEKDKEHLYGQKITNLLIKLSHSNIKIKDFIYLVDNLINEENNQDFNFYHEFSFFYGNQKYKGLLAKKNNQESQDLLLLNYLLINYQFKHGKVTPHIDNQEIEKIKKLFSKENQKIIDNLVKGNVDENVFLVAKTIFNLGRIKSSNLIKYHKNITDKLNNENKTFFLSIYYLINGINLQNILEDDDKKYLEISKKIKTILVDVENDLFDGWREFNVNNLDKEKTKLLISALGGFVGPHDYHQNRINELCGKFLAKIDDPELNNYFFNNIIGQGFIKEMENAINKEKTALVANLINQELSKKNLTKKEHKI